MEFSTTNSKKFKLMSVAVGFAALLTVAGRSAHATPTQDNYDTCISIELNDGKSGMELASECCFSFAHGGKLQCSGPNASDCACVGANEVTAEVEPTDTGTQHLSNLNHVTTGVFQQSTPPQPLRNFRAAVSTRLAR